MKGKGHYLIYISVILTLDLFLLSKEGLFFLSNRVLTAAQLTALVGTTLMSVSFFLASRFKILDYLFSGLDKAYRYHQKISALSFIFILNHFIFLIINRIPHGNWKILIFPSMDISYTTGILAFWSMTILIILTLFIDLPYHLWKKTHEYFGLVILFSMIHAMTISSDITRYMPLRYFMLSLIGLGIFSFVYRRFLYNLIGPHYKYRIVKLKTYGPVTEIVLIPLGKKMLFIPGQFAYLSIFHEKLTKEDHPFSIASAPFEVELRFSIKNDGDYTSKLSDLREGVTVSVWGPYGNFGERFLSKKNAVFVAGGIGISPFLSMAKSETAKQSEKNISIFYSVKNSSEAVYDNELKTLSWSHPNIRYKPNISEINGRLTAEQIKETVTEIGKYLIFLCGPPLMMMSLEKQFLSLGVKKHNIIFEDFSMK
ncbi:MAG: hypothetical protein UT63_C0068G0004 [Candidatus Gottesmanbacteria bacterium GW2011_GWC2_39_8]|uniref:FAD-binding FR-type domain-containing protein n=1 Tax=Candidatus Gottesmanbacteria bacterium GW2011_GWC2_39_8 TaxID=1618450 RepID=A0A0G0PTJ0_9BACT|nr:MAG: hypothetical protein UT63_C0068G0004 [Candidatus Gottesmanbacteria bacterium GW2011_GWC2_39_8]